MDAYWMAQYSTHMTHLTQIWKNTLFAIGILCLAAGLAVISYSGLGIFQAYHEVHQVRMYHLNTGNPDIVYLRPWMSIQYVSRKYGVPEAVLFTAIGLYVLFQFRKRR